METIIFRDSPLAEYLEGNGEGDSIWPGVGSSTFVDPTEPNQDFAPSARSISLNPRGKSKGKNLRLGPGWRRRNYLYELFSKLADARLSRSENASFLERFRYIVVASQLLGEHVNVSHYNRRSGDILPPQHTENDNESTAFFGPRFAKARYWTGNGICMGIITLIIGWVLKWGDKQKGSFSQSRAGLGILGISLVGIFLFSNARRRSLRTLRGRTIELATQFVENSQAYDILASNAVTFIQEVELVSRGYRLSTPLPPVSRLDRDSHMRRCARLRKSVLTSLNLAMTPYTQAFHALKELTQGADLDKYYDIYDIRNEDIENITSGIQHAEFDDMESLKALKALLHRLHTTRKIFLCCLLALDANGGYEEFGTWRTVVEQLKSLSTTMSEIAETLQRHSEEESRFSVPPTPSTTRPTTSSAISPTRERWRGKLRKLNSLSQALRGLQAKMQILREESDKTLQDDSMDLVEFGPDLLAHYDSIGSDLHALMSEWENGRALLVMSIDKQGGDSTGSNRNSLMTPLSPMGWGGQASSSSSLDGDTPRNSWGMIPSTGEGAEAVLRLKEKMGELSEEGEDVDDGKTEMIFEGTAEPRGAVKAKSGMSREERIRKVQEERVRLMEERQRKEEAGNLVKELQSVLGNRPPVAQRRIPVRSSSS